MRGTTNAPLNLVLEIRGTGGLKDNPALLLNAHLDTIEASTPEHLAYDGATRDFYHALEKRGERSSVGADDRVSVACIVEAVRTMNRLYWRKGAPHRRILIVLTAREEEGLVGAKYLAETYPEIFSNVAISLTMDGPLDLRSNYPADSIVAVVATKEASLSPYRRCIELVKAYCGETKLGFSTTEYGLGLGDFAAFPEIAKAGLHLRSPVRGWHDKERVKVDDLLNHTDLLCYLLLNWDRPDR